MTHCVWDDLVGQRRVAAYLRSAVESDNVSHAYLFLGPTGVGKKTAARALSCALFCEEACGSCSICRRVQANTHPDFHTINPGGVAGYVVEQIREITRGIHLKPIEAPCKIYVLEDAGRLRGAPANAFLKTLEEPPGDVVMILTAGDLDDVLPTVVSRCQVVRFSPVPESVALALVVERTGADSAEARGALAAAGGVIPRAIDFLNSAGRRNARQMILDIMKRLSVMDGHDVLRAARDLLTAVRAPVEVVKSAQVQEVAEVREFLSKGATAELEKRHKRELTAREREGVAEILNVTKSWLRDCLVIGKGVSDLVANEDAADATWEIAGALDSASSVKAIGYVEVARQRIAYNVNPQLAIEVMLFDIQEVLRCPR